MQQAEVHVEHLVFLIQTITTPQGLFVGMCTAEYTSCKTPWSFLHLCCHFCLPCVLGSPDPSGCPEPLWSLPGSVCRSLVWSISRVVLNSEHFWVWSCQTPAGGRSGLGRSRSNTVCAWSISTECRGEITFLLNPWCLCKENLSPALCYHLGVLSILLW